MTKQTLINILNYTIGILAAIQTLIPTLPPISSSPDRNAYFYKIISAIIIFLVPVLTAWKQKTSELIKDTALWPTLIVIIVAMAGGANDLFNVIHFTSLTQQWIRTTLTLIALLINLFSKQVIPSEKQKEIKFIQSQQQ